MKQVLSKLKAKIDPENIFFDSDNLEGKVLNFGCGNRKNPNHIGVDVSEKSDADYVVKPNEKLPFEDNTFDFVISRYVFEHIEDVSFALSEINRVLKPNGLLRFSVPHVLSLDAYDDPTHCNFFTLRSMKYYTGGSNIHYAESILEEAQVLMRVSLSYPRINLIRLPINAALISISRYAPNLAEQLLKLPFLSAGIYFELRKRA